MITILSFIITLGLLLTSLYFAVTSWVEDLRNEQYLNTMRQRMIQLIER